MVWSTSIPGKLARAVALLGVWPGPTTLAQDTKPGASTPSQQGLVRSAGSRIALGFTPRNYTYLYLLSNHKVLKELDLSPEQMDELKSQITKVIDFGKHQGKLNPPQKIDDNNHELAVEQAKVRGQQQFERAREIQRFEEGLYRRILSGKQMERWRELLYQAEGPYFFDRPEAQTELALTEDQIKTLKDLTGPIVKEHRAQVIAASRLRPPSEADSAAARLHREAMEQVLAGARSTFALMHKQINETLTAAQRKRFRILLGESFDFVGSGEPAVSPKN